MNPCAPDRGRFVKLDRGKIVAFHFGVSTGSGFAPVLDGCGGVGRRALRLGTRCNGGHDLSILAGRQAVGIRGNYGKAGRTTWAASGQSKRPSSRAILASSALVRTCSLRWMVAR